MSWENAVEKFERLSEPYADRELRREIAEATANLEAIRVADLTGLLTRIRVRAV